MCMAVPHCSMTSAGETIRPGDRGGCDRRRRRHIGVRLRAAEASLEVAAGIGDGVLRRRQHALVAAGARAAARHADGRAGLDHDVDQAFAHRLQIDFARARIDHHARVRRELLAFHDRGGDAEILDAAAGAGPEDRLVDAHVVELARRCGCRRGRAGRRPAARSRRRRDRRCGRNRHRSRWFPPSTCDPARAAP